MKLKFSFALLVAVFLVSCSEQENATETLKTKIVNKLTFKRCTFSQEVSINHLQVSNSLEFVDCEFNYGLSITEIEEVGNDPKLKDVPLMSFIGIEAKGGIFLLKDIQFRRSIMFNGNSKIIDVFNIQELVSEKGVVISEKGVVIIENQTVRTMNISNSKINFLSLALNNISSVKISYNTFQIINLSGNQINSNIDLTGGNINESLNISSGKFSGLFMINCISSEEGIGPNLGFVRSNFKEEVRVSNSISINNKKYYSKGFNKISILETQFENGIDLTGKTIDGNTPIIDTINIFSSNRLSGKIIFKNFSVNRFDIKGMFIDSILILSSCVFNKFEINEFSNYDTIKLLNVGAINNSKDSELSIIDTYLGNTELLNVDFSGFKNIKIHNSDIKDIKAMNVRWFEYNILSQSFDNEGETKIASFFEKLWKSTELLFVNKKNNIYRDNILYY